MQQLAKALAAVGGGVAGRALAGSPEDSVPPELRQLLHQSAQRQEYQNPLFQAATQGAYSMLPTFAKEGTSLGAFNPTPMTGAAGSGGGGINKGALAAGGGMAALAAALGKNGGSVDLGELFKKIKSLFGSNAAVQGDRPNAGGAMTGGGQGIPGFEGWGDLFANDYDFMNNPDVFSGMPNDPSGGSGVGPGMQDYYDSFSPIQTGGADGADHNNWWEE
jgi:hypothetical protein